MVFVRVVEVTIMQIIDVAAVADGGGDHNPVRAHEHGRDGSARSRSSWGDFLSISRIRGHCGAVLGRMFDGVTEHRGQVLVSERVENVLRLAPPF